MTIRFLFSLSQARAKVVVGKHGTTTMSGTAVAITANTWIMPMAAAAAAPTT